MNPIKKITVLYDERCSFCIGVARRLRTEPTFVKLEVLPMRYTVKEGQYTQVAPLIESGKFVVIANEKEVYLDTKARLMVLWALKRYREFSHILASPLLFWAVDLAFECISANRHFLSAFVAHQKQTPHKRNSEACASKTCDSFGCKDSV
jgi:predicted DCC family thiol-disulfide oxidoreductase YuxK